ncbi:mll4413 [Mesorhizobium japonicum MAFF 303099]|uniref:Mll4413 protein n=1 Tax=Mesorhizobium japonicum (strain LMG 29417 / CECT 9101 / MAFF 303099) TaxID=266835 RepID=Q98E47_RHILO|nr:mll4413 [Mesorhizobium japonicum MAFF 303099]
MHGMWTRQGASQARGRSRRRCDSRSGCRQSPGLDIGLQPGQHPAPALGMLGRRIAQAGKTAMADGEARALGGRRKQPGDRGLPPAKRRMVPGIGPCLHDPARRFDLEEFAAGRQLPAVGRADDNRPAAADAKVGRPVGHAVGVGGPPPLLDLARDQRREDAFHRRFDLGRRHDRLAIGHALYPEDVHHRCLRIRFVSVSKRALHPFVGGRSKPLPVSSRLLRLASTSGQPLLTFGISRCGPSASWVTASFINSPSCSMAKVQRV